MHFAIYLNMGVEQQSLFDVQNFVKLPAKKGSKAGKKRGPYNKNKMKDLNPWVEMGKCYRELASYCPYPLFNQEDLTIANKGLRLWYRVYKHETYPYFNEICTGEDFKIIEAEIIGTELMPIEWRLFLHLSLLDFLKDGFSLNDTMPYIHKLIKWHKTGLLLKDLFIYLWNLDCEALNG